MLPDWFTRIHPRWRTPVSSIVFVGCIVLLMSWVGVAGVGRKEIGRRLDGDLAVELGIGGW